MFEKSLFTNMIFYFIISALFSPTNLAENPVFGAYRSPSCDCCLNAAYTTCPGNFQDIDYGQCMCYRAGGSFEAELTAKTWYGYCIIFFPEMCAAAEKYVSPDIWANNCGAGSANRNSTETGDSSTGGGSDLESDGESSTSGNLGTLSASDSSNLPVTYNNSETVGIISEVAPPEINGVTTPTSTSNAFFTSATDALTTGVAVTTLPNGCTSNAFAAATEWPTWEVMAGIGLQLVHMNL
ncbi:hypothetical protein B0O99DRAFT_601618 [Bisporella sp. PMI_857]|nr:hypothetical protein B0O99DRAFT_601618 [Bisporella sp. PMI_857]